MSDAFSSTHVNGSLIGILSWIAPSPNGSARPLPGSTLVLLQPKAPCWTFQAGNGNKGRLGKRLGINFGGSSGAGAALNAVNETFRIDTNVRPFSPDPRKVRVWRRGDRITKRGKTDATRRRGMAADSPNPSRKRQRDTGETDRQQSRGVRRGGHMKRMMGSRTVWNIQAGGPGLWIGAVALAVVIGMACDTPGAAPLPTPTTWTQSVSPTETPVPLPQPGVTYHEAPPGKHLWVHIEQKPDYAHPVLYVTFLAYNPCTIPGEVRVEYAPGQVRVYVHQLVASSIESCPTGLLDSIVHRVPLDQLVNGDEVFLNDEFMFNATNLYCQHQRGQPCPFGCREGCGTLPGPAVCVPVCRPPSWSPTRSP